MLVSLDKYQVNAVYSKNKNTLVVAAPGSGKTTVIINRVNYLLKGMKAKIGNIIVITFTRAAAENMKSRYMNKFNESIAPFFGTFHGLFYKILLKEGYNIKIIDGGITYRIIKGVLAKFSDDVSDDKVKEALNTISLFKTSRLNLFEFEPKMPKDAFEECYNKYEEFKEKNGLWDFDDLSIKVLNILNNDINILSKYRRIFKFVLVDEFQDCDNMQIEFLKLINEDNSLFAVGDEDQCIYSFRGSNPEYMVIFDQLFKNGEKIYLSINYRSNKNIVDISKKLIVKNISRNNKEIVSNKQSEGIIKFKTTFDEVEQGEDIAKIIEIDKNNLKDNAILYRTNMEANAMIDILSKRRIPFILLDKGYNFFEHFICKDILSYLRLAIDIKDRESFTRIINKPFRYISKSNLAYVNSKREDISPFDILISKNDMPPYQIKAVDDLKKNIMYLNKLSLGSAIQFIVSDLGYLDYLKEYCDKYKQKLEELEDVIEEFKNSAKNCRTILELFSHVNNVREKIEENKNVEDGVILSTIHGVKGMEFKNVYIINVVNDIIPHKSAENVEEERRLFYVAMTRAIDNLYVYSPKRIAGKFRDVSDFVVESELGEANTEYKIPINSIVSHKAFGDGIVKEVKDGQIRIDFGNGDIKSFSVKILVDNNIITILN